jgi:hypothetical protein
MEGKILLLFRSLPDDLIDELTNPFFLSIDIINANLHVHGEVNQCLIKKSN